MKELVNEGGDITIRQAAGLAAKNALTAKVFLFLTFFSQVF